MGTCVMNCEKSANCILKDIVHDTILNKTTIITIHNNDSNLNSISLKPTIFNKSNISLKTNNYISLYNSCEKLQYNINSNKKGIINDNIKSKTVINKNIICTNKDLKVNNDENSNNLNNLENRKNSLNGPIYKKLLEHRKGVKT